MKKNKILSFLFICLITTIGSAQMKKAEKHFSKYNYAKAIPLFKKVIEKNTSEKQTALIKLADSYRILNNYTKAETYYAQAIGIGKVQPEVNYNYGEVLKSNNKYSEALNQYFVFLEYNENSKTTKNAIKSCQEIKYWESKPREYEIKNLENINTNQSEFSPVFYHNKLIYVSEKNSDLIDFDKALFNDQPFLNIYSVDIKNNKKNKSKLFSKKINSSFHDGPITFSGDGKTLAFTRVNYFVKRKNKNFVNRAKIYFSTINGKSVSKAVPFQYNSDEYSCAHPTLNHDGTLLIFSSDMPGSIGGQDLWMCKKTAEGWSKPVNLGFDINTIGREVFPLLKKDSVLFFSSDGLPGFGGLDILSAKLVQDKWLLRKNEGLLLNSSADDFGVFFENDSIGYFSSNRLGGKGSDDIYSFKYTNKSMIIDGIVLLTEDINNPAKGVKIMLLDKSNKKIDSTFTNEKGYFVFKDLEAEKTYMAEIADDNVSFKGKARYFLADKNNKISRVSHNKGNEHKYVFNNLPISPNSMPDLYNEDDLSMAGNLLYGESPSKPIANKKVIIKNEFGDVIEETTTNEFGAFAFRNLPIDQNYTLYVEDAELPENTKIILTNKKGKDVKIITSGAKGNFKFNILSTDKSTFDDLKVDDTDLIMALNGYLYDQDKKAMQNAKITIFNNNTVIENIITDEKGKFAFKNLNYDKDYLFTIDDTENKFKNVTKVYIADSKGRIYREIVRNNSGNFQFNLLKLDKTALGDFTIDDPWLQVLNMKNKAKQDAITIIENLYYASGDYKIDASGKNILDKVITVLNTNKNLNLELSSHTDSKNTDSFNQNLSLKRAKSAVDYLISKGINKNRLKAVGFGESKLLNHCKDGVDCSEEEHAKNRRTEFKIVEISKP